jgi:uncharacterized protein (UPF0332 family)
MKSFKMVFPMSSEERRAEVVRFWWEKAEESLASAGRELEAGAHTLAVNRLYYAAFYAVSAGLLERQLSFRKHSGVRASFHREFGKTGLVGVQWGKFYDQLFEDRQEGDYVAFTSFDREYVQSLHGRCTGFLHALRPLSLYFHKKSRKAHPKRYSAVLALARPVAGGKGNDGQSVRHFTVRTALLPGHPLDSPL